MKRRIPAQRVRAILAVPLALAAITLAGLVIGLTGDGARNLAATTLAGLPLLVFARAWARAKRSGSSQAASGKPKP